MKITVVSIVDSKTFPLEVEKTTSVDILKLKLSSKYDLNYNLLEISFNNVVCKNSSQTMESLGVQDGSHLQMKLLPVKRGKLIAINFSIIFQKDDLEFSPKFY